MRFLLLSLIGLLTMTAISQTEMVIRFDHMMGAEQFELNTEYNQTDLGYNFSITRLQYYVSEIEITHDGGQKTMISDTWLLVDASKSVDYSLGYPAINSVEGISFWIGVDQEHNHLDPTQYEAGHPLAPQNPVMHWGWAAGYRFNCLEGQTGFGLLLTYQIHALGDANYHEVAFETGAYQENNQMVIPIVADYMGLYEGINVSDGLIEHSESGAAATLLDNMSENVFSATYYTGVKENKFEGTFAIGPNPSTNGKAKAMLSLPIENTYNVSLIDLSGRLVSSEDIDGGNQIIELEAAHQGIYFVRLSQNGSPVATEKLVVTQ